MSETESAVDFIRQIVAKDQSEEGHSPVVTRFPPEPNGYLHIGHAKSICLNFGVPAEYDGGVCFLRFDDTNPSKETLEFVQAIESDVRWLGYDWGSHRTHASDYFEELYQFALRLINKRLAYVDSQSPQDMRAHRGSLTEPGIDSPYRGRSNEENLDLFERMRAGEFPEGSHVLRARIDMASPNINLRDPVLYRIMHRAHQNTGDRWCIYPMYDFAHGQCDYLEGVTHSLCTLEFEAHRPLYDWLIESLELEPPPRQYEFSRLNLTHTIMSKRFLSKLVNDGLVNGWDDPRMPTLQGLRRRGFTPASIRDFCRRIGVTKKQQTVEFELLETCIREDLDADAPRAMAVLDPLKVVIRSYPENQIENLPAANHPQQPDMGEREVPFSRVLYIERDDFMEDPPGKFRRLAPGREVRLRYAYLVTCVDVIKDPVTGEVTEVHCEHDPASRGGSAPDGRKVRGTLHWVCAVSGVPAQVRLYDRLFKDPHPSVEDEFGSNLNPDALRTLDSAIVEPALSQAQAGAHYQFERLGYFCADEKDTAPGRPVFNRTVTLRDSWAKKVRKP